jgi:cytochrome b6-f complex iron-sulfur subunit
MRLGGIMDKELTSGAPASEPEVEFGEGGEALGTQKLSRRKFIKIGMGALGTLALLEVSGAGFFFLRSRSLEGEYGGVIKAGPVDGFPANSVTEFADSHFFVIRSTDGGFLAVHNRCTHLGCTVNWLPSENRFVCPCHAATFDFYGNHQNPPVPRPLDLFPVQFDDGMVRVDTSQPQKRERFTREQLVYAPATLPAGETSQEARRGGSQGATALVADG